MLKKTSFPEFSVARLSEAPSGWHIRWEETNPDTLQLELFRRRFSMNRIKKVGERRRYARHMVDQINQQLYRRGNYFYSIAEVAAAEMIPKSERMSFAQAIQHALELKKTELKHSSYLALKSIVKKFLAYLQEKRISALPVLEAQKPHVRPFFHKLKMSTELGAHGYNNHITALKGLMTLLIDEGLAEKNPFEGIKRMKKTEKNRLYFTADQARRLLPFFAKQDFWLHKAILIQLFCYVRPNEIRFLQARHFNFSNSTVQVKADSAKLDESRAPTIPIRIIKLIEGGLRDLDPACYLFSTGIKPGNKPCGKNAFNDRHRKLLEQAQDKGLITRIKNLTFYSWKDAGITHFAKTIPLTSVRDQAGHKNIDTTLLYYHKDKINKDFLNLDVSEFLKG